MIVNTCLIGERAGGGGVSFTVPLLQPVSITNNVATARSRERMLPFLRKSISLHEESSSRASL
jgi:hypothetical protein